MSFLVSLLAGVGLLALTPRFALENTSIAGFADDSRFTGLNRLRLDLTVNHDTYEGLAARLQLDNKTLYVEQPAGFSNDTSIYRGYLEYRGASHFWTLGRQRIPLGVGRVWNPIDIFNPIDSQSTEPEERAGAESLHYEYAMSRLANLDLTLSRDKGEGRIKGYLDVADVALVTLYDNEAKLDIIGWELEGELFDTGIELRSEGGSFHDRDADSRRTAFIVGAEYGFANSLILLTEYLYDDETKRDNMAVSASFQPRILWTVSCLAVQDLADHSFFVSPAVEYSAGDEMTIRAGAFLYHGSTTEAYGGFADRLYVRWFVHF